MGSLRMESIGWIGLGKMGLPICRRLAAAGKRVTVYARNEQAEAKARAEGFATCRSLDALATQDIILSAIPDDAALRGLMIADFLQALSVGAIFMDISTVSPAASAEVAAMLEGAGVQYIRMPVSGSTLHATNGQLTAMVSGPRATYDALLDFIGIFCARHFYLGAGEQARYLKLAINSILAANSALVAEALAIGEAGGLQRADMLEVMTQSAIATPLLGYKKDLLVRGDYPAAFSVRQIIKDLDLVLGTASADHVSVPVNAVVRARFEQASLDGCGDEDFFCLSGAPKG